VVIWRSQDELERHLTDELFTSRGQSSGTLSHITYVQFLSNATNATYATQRTYLT